MLLQLGCRQLQSRSSLQNPRTSAAVSEEEHLLVQMALGTRQTHLLPGWNIRGLHLATPQGYRGRTEAGRLFVPFLLLSWTWPDTSKVLCTVCTGSSEKLAGTNSVPGAGARSLGASATRASGRHSRGLCVISWRPSAHRGC